jgi:hypothetical protein
LAYWNRLIRYEPTEITRQKLLEFSRQLDGSNKILNGLKCSLQAILDTTFPGIRKILTSNARPDGHIKWVDFVCAFEHCERVSCLTFEQFSQRYKKWCKKSGYNFTKRSCSEIYNASQNQITTLPCDKDIKLLINEYSKQLTAVSAATEVWRSQINQLAKLLPEYECVKAMYGCGETTAPQLMAEIGDPARFRDRFVDGKKIKAASQLVCFAGISPNLNQSGSYDQKSNKTSKKGSPHLRKTLFSVVGAYLKHSPVDEPVYQFLDKKRSEGKLYLVYMTAASNKFLRHYYAKIRDFLAENENGASPNPK